MKANTIYLGAVVVSVIFIVIFAIILVLIKPKSEDSHTSPERKKIGGSSEDRTNKQSNNDNNNDDNQSDGQRDDNYDYEPKSKLKPKPKPKPDPKPMPDLKPKPGSKIASFSENCVLYHNKYRSKHRQTNVISESQKLKVSAQRKADIMAKTNDFSHTKGLDAGENLWYYRISRGSAQLFSELDCYKPLKAWYDEVQLYNYLSPTQSSGVVGHFTQMVWRATKQIGCAKSHSGRTGSIYVVCHYSPSGNVIGRYTQNVYPII